MQLQVRSHAFFCAFSEKFSRIFYSRGEIIHSYTAQSGKFRNLGIREIKDMPHVFIFIVSVSVFVSLFVSLSVSVSVSNHTANVHLATTSLSMQRIQILGYHISVDAAIRDKKRKPPHNISVLLKIVCCWKGVFCMVLRERTYSVTQSLCNSLLGDVVLDSFNKVYRYEDSILDQTYQKQICSYFYYYEF